ncbi:reverse transcriptase-like protein [Elysia marginata]|uniref:Reverse transcriptase-like protein n=1 Tax=Elysia marginata TaxID=1093978 RepID=A0AAV4GCF0_9GAST|nr:reverse transcriptase-like protein [Elysia marginata]
MIGYQRRQLTPRPELEPTNRYKDELDMLRGLLHFPEEVALHLTTTERKLFASVPSQHYVRHVTMELSRPLLQNREVPTLEDLIQRFNEVSSWVTQLIVTQATHDDRKAVLSCILRLAVYCWVLGNFNSAVEILCGLRKDHSTETAVLRVFNDLLVEADLGKVSVLCLLDLSAAFDSLDHNIMLTRLEKSFGIKHTVLQWFQSYRKDREQTVVVDGVKSAGNVLKYGVPQGSVLGPVLFTIYTQPLARVLNNFGLKYHFYADDSQIYGSCQPENISDLINTIELCVSSKKPG